MPIININGSPVSMSVKELVEYERLSKATTFSPNANPPAATTQCAPEPKRGDRDAHDVKTRANRVRLTENGVKNATVTRAALSVLVEQTGLLPHVQTTEDQLRYLETLPKQEKDDINELIALVGSNFRTDTMLRHWRPGISAAAWAVRLDGDEEQYQKLITRLRINREFRQLITAANQKVYTKYGLERPRRKHLTEKGRRELFEELYFMFSDKDLKVGFTE